MLSNHAFYGYDRTGERDAQPTVLLRCPLGKVLALHPTPPVAVAHHAVAKVSPPLETTGLQKRIPKDTEDVVSQRENITDWADDALEIQYVLSSVGSDWGSSFSTTPTEGEIDGSELIAASKNTNDVSPLETSPNPNRQEEATEGHAALPLHGAVLEMRRAFHHSKLLSVFQGPSMPEALNKNLSLQGEAGGNSDGSEMGLGVLRQVEAATEQMDPAYYTVVILGYTTDGRVYLHPTPELHQPVGQPFAAPRRYSEDAPRCTVSPILVCSIVRMMEVYTDVTASVLTLPETISACVLPAAEGLSSDGRGLMSGPPLVRNLLSTVFHVTDSVGAVYYLSKRDRYVRFLGVACGVPWVVDVVKPRVNTEALGGLIPPLGSWCDPLPLCHDERALLEQYGLCDPSEGNAVVVTGGRRVSGFKHRCHPSVLEPNVSRAAAPASEEHPITSALPPPPCETEHICSVAHCMHISPDHKVSVLGPFGVILSCDVHPSILTARYGVAHGDRLVGLAGGSFDQRTAVVVGVSADKLVALLNGESKATVLGNVASAADLQQHFAKVTAEVQPLASVVDSTADVLNVRGPTCHDVKTSAVVNPDSDACISEDVGSICIPSPKQDPFHSDPVQEATDKAVVTAASLPTNPASDGKLLEVTVIPENDCTPFAAAMEGNDEAALDWVSSEGMDSAPGGGCSDEEGPADVLPLAAQGEPDPCEAFLADSTVSECGPLLPLAPASISLEPKRSVNCSDHEQVKVSVGDRDPRSDMIAVNLEGHQRGVGESVEGVAGNVHLGSSFPSPSVQLEGSWPREVHQQTPMNVSDKNSRDALRSCELEAPTTHPTNSCVPPCPPMPAVLCETHREQGLLQKECARGTAHNYAFLHFLKAYSLYKQLAFSVTNAETVPGAGAAITIEYIQRFYHTHTLARMLEAVEAQRKCRVLWATLRGHSRVRGMGDTLNDTPTAHQFHVVSTVCDEFDDLCVDEMVTFMKENEYILYQQSHT